METLRFIWETIKQYSVATILIFIIITLVTFNILLSPLTTKENTKPKSKPKTYITAVDTTVVYAGRFDSIPEPTGATNQTSKYMWNGVPRYRQWLTYKEWKGRHCTNRTMRKAFKKWKRNEIDSFIDFMCMAAVNESKVYTDIPPELIVAQSILESNFGKSRLSVQANNLFGHKYVGNDSNQYVIAKDDSPRDKFTKYQSVWYSIRNHSKLLMRKYRKRIDGDPNLDKWLYALCGGLTTEQSMKFIQNGGSIYASACYKGDICYSKILKILINNFSLKERCKKYGVI
jgi:flagellum-specific peptidoglycan hydrolase FlgJ